mmetsp:Transcript_70114/g.162161  ORF Transcript_70114/g.162161 Transcript_70114/m.162161 type:complete len:222 (-) Transcript_70114:313-978(-)
MWLVGRAAALVHVLQQEPAQSINNLSVEDQAIRDPQVLPILSLQSEGKLSDRACNGCLTLGLRVVLLHHGIDEVHDVSQWCGHPVGRESFTQPTEGIMLECDCLAFILEPMLPQSHGSVRLEAKVREQKVKVQAVWPVHAMHGDNVFADELVPLLPVADLVGRQLLKCFNEALKPLDGLRVAPSAAVGARPRCICQCPHFVQFCLHKCVQPLAGDGNPNLL